MLVRLWAALKAGALWRGLILLATLFSVAMLFAPLVQEMIMRMTEMNTDALP